MSCVGAERFDLILAIDSFPFIVRAGVAVAREVFANAATALMPRGDLVIFNYSYRDDLDADRRDIARLSETFGLAIVRNGTRDLTLWDGAAFHLRKAAM